MNVLEIKNLKKSFGAKTVLDGVNLSVEEGTVFGFIGRNGAGKTTTMKIVLGLLEADEGEIYVCGEKVEYGSSKTNRLIGYLPDVPEFYPYMSAREYLRLCGNLSGMSKAEIKTRSKELLAMVGLSKEKGRISGYSRGMKQRLGIAQALMSHPKLLICDEPTSALDPLGRKDILNIISQITKETTVIFSTHILSDVEKVCQDMAILEKGTIQMSGNVNDIRLKHTSGDICIVPVHVEDLEKIVKLAKASLGENLKTNFDVEDSSSDAFTNSEEDRTNNDFNRANLNDGRIILKNTNQGSMALLMQKLVEEKIDILKIEQMEPDLDQLFMEVTQHE